MSAVSEGVYPSHLVLGQFSAAKVRQCLTGEILNTEGVVMNNVQEENCRDWDQQDDEHRQQLVGRQL